MRLGTYIFSGTIFIIFVVGTVYLLTPDYYSLSLMGITLNLPIAAWVGIPALILFVLTILHMGYHGTKSYINLKKWQKDVESAKDALYWALIAEPKKHNYSIAKIKEGAILLNGSTLTPTGNMIGLSEKLDKTVEIIKNIQNGEYVNLNEHNIERHMGKNNPILVKNQLNRLEKDSGFADEILHYRENYDDSVVSRALDIVIESGNLFKVKKYASLMNGEQFHSLMKKIEKSGDIKINFETVEDIMKENEMGCPEYIAMARAIHKKFTPDETLSLFRRLASEREEAQNAYLYLLFEYEMLDEVKRFLEEYDESEFKPFRAFQILKRGKYHYKIDDLINSSIVCK